MVNAVANSVVPKLTVIVGNSYGAGNYAMCGKAYDPRFIVGWPSAKIAVMGGGQASKTLLAIRLQAMKKTGEELSEDDRQQMLKELKDRYDSETDPLFGAARLWIDGIIDPVNTRDFISRGIEIANYQGEMPKFNPGVIQT